MLRKRYGSVQAFEQTKGLPRDSVSDVLRGRTAGRTMAAIEEELTNGERVSQLGNGRSESDKSDEHTLIEFGRHTNAAVSFPAAGAAQRDDSAEASWPSRPEQR